MVKTVSAAEARANLGDLLNSVYYTKEPVIVQKKGKTMGIIISPEEYERIQEADRQDWALIQEFGKRNADKDIDAVMADVTAEVEAVRRENYAE